MEIRSMSGQNTYLARETVAGTAETTEFFGLSAIRMTPGWEGDRDIFRGGSGKVASTTIATDEVSPWETEMSPDFNHLGLVLASRFGIPVTTTPGGGTLSRNHVFTISPTREDTFRSYTARWGDGYYGVLADYGYFNSLSMDIQRGDLSFDTSFRSRAAQFGYTAPTSEVQTLTITGSPAGGTFTLTYAGQTTTAIAYNATAAAVQAALIALSNIGPLDVVCAGGPLPATAVTITFQGTLAQTDVVLITANDALLTGGTTPTAAVAQTTPGSTPTDVVAAPMPSNMWNVWMDANWAAIGTTQYGGAYMTNIDFGDKFDEDAPINSSIVSYEKPIEKMEQDDTFDLTLRLGATAQTLVSAFQAGTKQFFRLGLLGPVIEGAITYACNVDFVAEILSRGNVESAPNSSAVVLPLTLVLSKDSLNNYARVTLVNSVLAY